MVQCVAAAADHPGECGREGAQQEKQRIYAEEEDLMEEGGLMEEERLAEERIHQWREEEGVLMGAPKLTSGESPSY